ncbi:MAG: ATP-binding protein [Chloroflexota bacterium]|nr:ATP-binding protein [Chloroflexota bacterium]
MQVKNYSQNGKRPLQRLQILIVAITLTAVVAVILLGSQNYREAREMATEQFNRQQLILARAAAAGIESHLEEIGEELPTLAEMPAVQAMTSECLTYMQLVYGEESQKASIRRLDKDGILRLIYPNEGWQKELIGRDYSEEICFIEAKETGKRAVSGLITNEVGELHLRVAYPVFIENGKEAKEFNGVIVASFDIGALARLYISPIVSGETGYVWLLNEEGVFLAHHEEGLVGRDAFEVRPERGPDISYAVIEQIQRRMMAGEEGVGRYVSGWHRERKGEIEKLIAYTPVHIDGHVWSVAVCAPVSEVEEIIHAAKRSARHTLALVVLVLVTGGLSLLVISHRWSRSLEREVARRTRELRESEARYRLLVETANDAICALDTDLRVTDVNPYAEQAIGYSRDEFIGRTFLELGVLAPASLDQAIENTASVLAGERVSGAVYEFITKDGRHLLGELSGAPIYREGRVAGVLTIARDVTERERVEEALRRRVEELAVLQATVLDITAPHNLPALLETVVERATQLLSGLSGGMYLCDPDREEARCVVSYNTPHDYTGIVLKYGEGAAGTVAQTGKSLIIDDYRTWSRRAAVYEEEQPFTAVLSAPMIWYGQVTGVIHVLHDVETRHFTPADLKLLTLFANHAAIAVENTRLYEEARKEITERKRVEEERERLLAELEAKNRELESFTYTVSHDLRAPLTSIYGFSSLLQEDVYDRLNEEDQHCLERVLANVAHMDALLTHLLELSRIGRVVGPSEEVDVVALLREIQEDLAVKLEEAGTEFVAQELPTVHADRTRLRQVFANLIDNALKFRSAERPLRIEVGCQEEGGYYRFHVSDNGAGIAPRHQERIFAPFQQLDTEAEGVGMGLALVKKIVEHYGGRIWVESEAGEGATFYFTIPVITDHRKGDDHERSNDG